MNKLLSILFITLLSGCDSTSSTKKKTEPSEDKQKKETDILISKYSSGPFGLFLDMSFQDFEKLAQPSDREYSGSNYYEVDSSFSNIYDYNYIIYPPKPDENFFNYYALVSKKYGVCSITAKDEPAAEFSQQSFDKGYDFDNANAKYNKLKVILIEKYGEPFINSKQALPYNRPVNENYSNNDFIPEVGYNEELKSDYSNMVKAYGMTEWITENKYHITLSSYIGWNNNVVYPFHTIRYESSNFEKCESEAVLEINSTIKKLKFSEDLKYKKQLKETVEKSTL